MCLVLWCGILWGAEYSKTWFIWQLLNHPIYAYYITSFYYDAESVLIMCVS